MECILLSLHTCFKNISVQKRLRLSILMPAKRSSQRFFSYAGSTKYLGMVTAGQSARLHT